MKVEFKQVAGKRYSEQAFFYHLSFLILLICISLFASCFFLSCLDWSDEASNAFESDNETSDNNNNDDNEILEETWKDSTSGLMWLDGSDIGVTKYIWDEAISLCQDLTWASYDDWHLPTISELRSLISGCDDTETGGSCGVTDSCLESSCQDENYCDGCPPWGDEWSCTYPSGLNGDCGSFWSSSAVADDNDLAWGVYFGDGSVYNDSDDYGYGVRCVR